MYITGSGGGNDESSGAQASKTGIDGGGNDGGDGEGLGGWGGGGDGGGDGAGVNSANASMIAAVQMSASLSAPCRSETNAQAHVQKYSIVDTYLIADNQPMYFTIQKARAVTMVMTNLLVGVDGVDQICRRIQLRVDIDNPHLRRLEERHDIVDDLLVVRLNKIDVVVGRREGRDCCHKNDSIRPPASSSKVTSIAKPLLFLI